jgi:hypothetical protein
MKRIKLFEDYYDKDDPAPGVIEFDTIREIENYKTDNDLSPSRHIFLTDEDKKRFSFFIGKIDPLMNKKAFSLNYDFIKKIGFGLSQEARTKYSFSISRNESKNGDQFFIMNLYSYNKATRHSESKYYLSYDLESMINKIKEIKND